jgi:tRNA (uracil-5-)-methyltransferase
MLIYPAGEGIGLAPHPKRSWAILVPFSIPGEIVRARVYRHSRLHSFADLVSVVRPNHELRDDNRVKCRYFGTCAGCQYQVRPYAFIRKDLPAHAQQMLSYEKQLDLKRDVVVKAFANYFGKQGRRRVSTTLTPRQRNRRTCSRP